MLRRPCTQTCRGGNPVSDRLGATRREPCVRGRNPPLEHAVDAVDCEQLAPENLTHHRSRRKRRGRHDGRALFIRCGRQGTGRRHGVRGDQHSTYSATRDDRSPRVGSPWRTPGSRWHSRCRPDEAPSSPRCKTRTGGGLTSTVACTSRIRTGTSTKGTHVAAAQDATGSRRPARPSWHTHV